MGSESNAISTVTDAEKEENAKKAKQKFLENLHKFQRKASESSSPFQRSYRGSAGQPNGAANHLRSSHRPNTSRDKMDLVNLSRRSLRVRRRPSAEDHENSQTGDVDRLRSTIRKLKRSSKSEIGSNLQTNDESKPADNNSNANKKLARAPSNGIPASTNHNTRRRREGRLVPSTSRRIVIKETTEFNRTPARETSSNINNSQPNHLKSDAEVQYQNEATCLKDISNDYVNVSSTNNSLFNSTQERTNLIDPTDVSILSNSSPHEIVTRPSTLFENQLLHKSPEFQDNDIDVNTFERANTESPTIVSKRELLKTSARNRKESKPAAEARADSHSSSSPPTFETFTKPDKESSNLEEKLIEHKLNLPGYNKPFENTTQSKVRNDADIHFAETNPILKSSPIHTPLKLLKSPESSSSKSKENDNVDFNPEEAIDTFKRLSLEIDAIKHIGFRRSITDPRDPPKHPLEVKSNISSGDHFTIEESTTIESRDLPMASSPQLPSYRVEGLSSNSHGSSAKTMPQTSSAREKRKAIKERKKKEENFSQQSRVSVTKDFENGLATTDNKVALSSNSTEEKVAEKTKSSHQQSCFNNLEQESETVTTKPAHEVKTSSSELKLEPTRVDRKSNARTTMPSSVKSNFASSAGSVINFRKLSIAQRKEKLRQVLLRHRSELSDSESSSTLSDGSSDSSEIDMDWLEDGGDTEESVFSDASRKSQSSSKSPKNHSRINPTSKSSEVLDSHVANDDSAEEQRASVGNMMSLWETKAIASSKPTRNTPVLEIEETRGKISGTKAVWESSNNHTSTPVEHRRRMSFEDDKNNDGSDVKEEHSSRDIGSILSMWEKKLDEKKSSANARTVSIDDEIQKSTVGKLRCAKNIFENISKLSNENDVHEEKAGEISPIVTPSINNIKSMFETKLSPRNNGVNEQRRGPPRSPASPNKVKSQTRSEFKSPSRLQTFSNGEDRKVIERRTFSNDDNRQSNLSSDDDITQLSSNQRLMKRTSSINRNKMSEAWETSQGYSSPVKREQQKPSPKSNIQNKISARRKRSRRPMTQPVTVDDVTSAKQLMHDKKTTGSQSQEEDQTSEEEVSFADRLAFFNKLVTKSDFRSKTDRPQSQRASLKRHLTQPVDRDEVEQARKLHLNKDKINLAKQVSAENSAGDTNKPSSKKSPTSSACGEIPFPSSDIDKEKKPERSLEDKPRKVGKLSSELRTKFLENNSPIKTSLSNRLASSSSNSTEFSDTSSSISSRSTPISFRSGDHSSSRFGSKVSSLRSEDLSSNDSDMGRTRETEIKATGSIHDRLKLLEKNKDEGWRKRVKDDKKVVKSSLEDRMSKLQEKEDKWKKSKPGDVVSSRSSSGNKANISDRLNSIMSNSESWKSKRGKQNDATQFTTEAKIAQRDGLKLTSLPSPTPVVKRRDITTPVSDKPVITIKDVSSDQPSLNKLSEVLKLSQKGLEPEVIKKTSETTTDIPDLVDAGFETFFTAATSPLDESEKIFTNGVAHSDSEESATIETPAWLEEDPVEQNKTNSSLSDIGRLKASVKRPSVRNKRSSRNPVKALAARTDIKQSYTEQRSNVTKLEQQRIASVHGNAARFTNAALAGLAYKADFSKVNLRSTKKTSAFSASDHKPWRNKMLLRVKGRRHVQTRLVAPSASSLNSGDAFLLILPQKLFAWFGEYSNVIEKAKVQEIADYIIHKGDMGSKASSLTIIKEESSSSIRCKEFWNLIGGRGEIEVSGGAEEDEIYEVNTEAAIKSYELEESKLVPHKPSWGKFPTMGQLTPSSTFVFDFGAEMYIWHGKEVSFEDRQVAVKLAHTLWDQGYDYTELGFSPFTPISKSSTDLKGKRPEWGLFARVNENLETALVQEKFEDWSNIAREIGDREEVLKETSRGQVASEMKVKTNIAPDMTSCDVDQMHDCKSARLRLVLEGHNMWKGHGLIHDDDGRGLEVHTSSVDVWHASDNDIHLLNDNDKGVFCRNETYVIRWRYVISSTGKWKAEKAIEDLKSDVKGRERVAYFLWTGSGSTVNEKGASALMATEIDKDGGPQVAVTDGKEPPALCQCFNGGMVVADGKKGSRQGFYSWKLFCVRGGSSKEGVLYQVPCNVTSLRSRSSFVALQGRSGKLVVWHGAKSPSLCREIAEKAASKIQEEKRQCLGFRVTSDSVSLTICEEENENEDFTEAVGRMRRNKYLSLTGSKPDTVDHPRMWHLKSENEKFVANYLEHVAETLDNDDVISFFPITQEQLKEIPKPAFVLLENSEGLYLWLSAFEEELAGSFKRQYDINKRLSMETVVNYSKKFRSDVTPMVIHENFEPLEFTNSFLTWKESDKKFSYEEKRENKPKPVADVLKTISRLVYSLEELRSTPLPEGVDPNHLETYLSAADFVRLFEMSKDEFYALPPWKQQNIRKEKNFF